MALFGSNIDYTKLIQFTGGSIRVASFVEIRDALIKRQREIYGNDIDVSTASADGQFINEIALILNNILQTVLFAYDSLDPAVATGKYLDVLCSYNNIQRIGQTASTAELYIHNPSGDDWAPESILFSDRAGQLWRWDNTKDIDGQLVTSFKAGSTVLIRDVKCSAEGPVQAPGSPFIKANGDPTDDISLNDWSRACPRWIYQTVESTPVRVWQYADAVVGNEEETDEALRSRRHMLVGNKSVSVLEGLQGSLLNVSGIEDVYIFNNMTGSNETLDEPINDGTIVPGHCIYVTLRLKEGVTIEDSFIGKLIYNKLTPGVGTTPVGYDANGEYPDPGSPGHEDSKQYEIQRTSSISYKIFWKQAQPAKPAISLTFSYRNGSYDLPVDGSGSIITGSHGPITEVEKRIAANVIEYMGKVKLCGYAQPAMIMSVAQQADMGKLGVATFFVTSCTIGGSTNNKAANLSYFKYNASADCSITYDTVAKTGTMVLS